MLCLGGGGYVNENAAKCYAQLTLTLLGIKLIENQIPDNDFYFKHYKSNSLELKASKTIENKNDNQYLRKLIGDIERNLSSIK